MSAASQPGALGLPARGTDLFTGRYGTRPQTVGDGSVTDGVPPSTRQGQPRPHSDGTHAPCASPCVPASRFVPTHS